MTTTNYEYEDVNDNYFRLSYIYNSLLIEERTETLIYDFIGITKKYRNCFIICYEPEVKHPITASHNNINLIFKKISTQTLYSLENMYANTILSRLDYT